MWSVSTYLISAIQYSSVGNNYVHKATLRATVPKVFQTSLRSKDILQFPSLTLPEAPIPYRFLMHLLLYNFLEIHGISETKNFSVI